MPPETLTEAQEAVTKCVAADAGRRREAAEAAKKAVYRLANKQEDENTIESDKAWWK